MELKWVDIEGFNDYYSVSNRGKVVSLERLVKCSNGYMKKIDRKILKDSIDAHGYYVVNLYKGGMVKKQFVHKLVADAFIPNPLNKPCVNHIDGDKTNNSVDNLEHCTYTENNQHAYDIKLKVGAFTGKFGKDHHISKPVVQMDMDGAFICRFESAREASSATGIGYKAISRVCNNERHHTHNTRWKFDIK